MTARPTNIVYFWFSLQQLCCPTPYRLQLWVKLVHRQVNHHPPHLASREGWGVGRHPPLRITTDQFEDDVVAGEAAVTNDGDARDHTADAEEDDGGRLEELMELYLVDVITATGNQVQAIYRNNSTMHKRSLKVHSIINDESPGSLHTYAKFAQGPFFKDIPNFIPCSL